MTTNKCEPEAWLHAPITNEEVWSDLERKAQCNNVSAAALLAHKSLLETHRVAGMDIYERLDKLEARIDKVLALIFRLQEDAMPQDDND